MEKIGRRELLLAMLGGYTALASGHLGKIASDVVPSFLGNFSLSEEEKHVLLDRLKGNTVSFGFYPDFEADLPLAVASAVSFQKELLQGKAQSESSVRQVGFFALLEDLLTPEWEYVQLQRIQEIQRQGLVPLISLGTGSFLQPHPFTSENMLILESLIDRWNLFLQKRTVGEIGIRFLFEANIFAGNIAYKNNGYLPEKVHQSRYKRLVEYLARKIADSQELRSRVHLELSFAAAGASIGNYFPDALVRAVGVDIYDELYGRLAVATLYRAIGDLPPLAFPNPVLVELLTTVKNHFGTDTQPVIHEIGVSEKSFPWFEATLLLSLFGGIERVMYFGIDQRTRGEVDFRPTQKVLQLMREVLSLQA